MDRIREHRLRIAVLGYIVRGPVGGMVWHHLQYVLGLERLGHEVYFVEDSDDYPSCYDPERHVTDTDPTYGLRFTERLFRQVGMAERWAYYDRHTRTWLGPLGSRGEQVCADADLVLNVSGVNPLRPWAMRCPVRVLIDTDPVFTQVRHLTNESDRERAHMHTAFYSFGENIGRPQCSIPPDGFAWRPTRQPIVLDLWKVTSGLPGGRYTTVMLWNSYPPRSYGGMRYGLKSHSFSPYRSLPETAGPILEIALGGRDAPRDELKEMGWSIVDPHVASVDPWGYQRYIRQSKGEFSVAKHGYVVSRSGWFSERSAAYLASGRPVIVQDTGFSDWLTAEGGVIPFESPAAALASIQEVDAHYDDHCRAARAVAEQHFDSKAVLCRLLDSAMNDRVVPG